MVSFLGLRLYIPVLWNFTLCLVIRLAPSRPHCRFAIIQLAAGQLRGSTQLRKRGRWYRKRARAPLHRASTLQARMFASVCVLAVVANIRRAHLGYQREKEQPAERVTAYRLEISKQRPSEELALSRETGPRMKEHSRRGKLAAGGQGRKGASCFVFSFPFSVLAGHHSLGPSCTV